MSIRLTTGDIGKMVKAVLNEVHGAISDKLLGLADYIIERIKTEDEFRIDKETLLKYYPYKNCPEFLNVCLGLLPRKGAVASYNGYTQTIKIDFMAILQPERLKSILMHELTHFVNINAANDVFGAGKYPFRDGTLNSDIFVKIGYLFDPTEMQARVSQFKEELKINPGLPLNQYERITYLQFMKNLILCVKNDEYIERDYDNIEYSIVDYFLMQRGYQRSCNDFKTRYLNIGNVQEHERAKAAIVKNLEKKYNKYFTSISKIYYDSVSSSKK